MKLIDAINYYKQNGFLKFMKRVFNRLGFVYCNHSLLFFHVDLKGIANDFIGTYKFHIATIDDIQKEQGYYDGWYTKERAIRRLQNGHRLLVSRFQEKIAAYQWLEFEKVKINWFELHFDIPQDFVYYKSTYTIPEARGTGLGSKTNKEVLHYLKREGFNHVFCVIDPVNTASIRLFTKNGFKEYQRVNYRRYWHIRYYKVVKASSHCSKRFIALFKSPENLWKTYL